MLIDIPVRLTSALIIIHFSTYKQGICLDKLQWLVCKLSTSCLIRTFQFLYNLKFEQKSCEFCIGVYDELNFFVFLNVALLFVKSCLDIRKKGNGLFSLHRKMFHVSLMLVQFDLPMLLNVLVSAQNRIYNAWTFYTRRTVIKLCLCERPSSMVPVHTFGSLLSRKSTKLLYTPSCLLASTT